MFLGTIKSRYKVRMLAYEKLGYYTVSQPVHTTVEKLENAALFLQLGLLFTLIPHDEAFRKSSSNRRNLKTSVRRFCVDGNLENGRSQVICLTKFPSNTRKHKSQMTVDCSVFRVKTPVLTFSRRGLSGLFLELNKTKLVSLQSIWTSHSN